MPLRGPEGDVELDIGDAERDAPEPRGVRLVAAHAIAPGTYRLDMVVVLAEGEGGAGQFGGDGGEPLEQGLAAGDDDAGMAAQHLRRAARQMKLAAADIDPHVAVGHHQIGIAGQPETGDIEQGRQPLVGHLDVDVFEMDRVAEIFGGAVEWLLHGRGSPNAFYRIIGKCRALIQSFVMAAMLLSWRSPPGARYPP